MEASPGREPTYRSLLGGPGEVAEAPMRRAPGTAPCQSLGRPP